MTEQLSRLAITNRSSPVAAPIAALIGDEVAEHHRVLRSRARPTRRRVASSRCSAAPSAAHSPPSPRAARPRQPDHTSAHRRGEDLGDGVVDHRRHGPPSARTAPSRVSWQRRKGRLVTIGARRRLPARRSATAAAWRAADVVERRVGVDRPTATATRRGGPCTARGHAGTRPAVDRRPRRRRAA